jgi:hypothetical protein
VALVDRARTTPAFAGPRLACGDVRRGETHCTPRAGRHTVSLVSLIRLGSGCMRAPESHHWDTERLVRLQSISDISETRDLRGRSTRTVVSTIGRWRVRNYTTREKLHASGVCRAIDMSNSRAGCVIAHHLRANGYNNRTRRSPRDSTVDNLSCVLRNRCRALALTIGASTSVSPLNDAPELTVGVRIYRALDHDGHVRDDLDTECGSTICGIFMA